MPSQLSLTSWSLLLIGCIESTEPPAPAPGKLVRSADPIEHKYIVVLETGDTEPGVQAVDLRAPDVIERLAIAHSATVEYEYHHALHGFAATMSEEQALALAGDPEVAYVAEDSMIYVDGQQSPAIWGLDRIDQPTLPLDSTYRYLNDGAGVTVYVLDSGIRATHTEFTGRVLPGYTSINDGQGTNDCNQHGTHVSGTIAGTVLGVAKGVSIVPVRVVGCDGSGSVATFVAGIDWVMANRRPRAIVNMSLGAPANTTEDTAVRNLISAGVTVVTSAGNNNVDACTQTPARVAEAITVAATDNADRRASFSNYGACVDLHAPGVDIYAASFNGDALARYLSGTSMAAPHVTGVAALYLAAHQTATPAEIAQALTTGATTKAITDLRGSPDRLLSSFAVDTLAPVASITSPANGATVGSDVTVTASVVDETLRSVVFTVDGKVVATKTTEPLTAQLTALAPGSHYIAVTATDANQRTSTSSVQVTVAAAPEPMPEPEPDDLAGGCSTSRGGGLASLLFVFVAISFARRARRRATICA